MELEGKKKKKKISAFGNWKETQTHHSFMEQETPLPPSLNIFLCSLYFCTKKKILISSSIAMQVLTTVLSLRTLLVISLCILSVCIFLNTNVGEERTWRRGVIPVSTEETSDVQHWAMLSNLAYFLSQIKDRSCLKLPHKGTYLMTNTSCSKQRWTLTAGFSNGCKKSCVLQQAFRADF